MELVPGQKVTLCSFEEAKTELYRHPPGIVEPMRKYFGTKVTVRNQGTSPNIFTIEEDDGWKYHKDWIVLENVTHIPSKMRRMM